MHSKDIAIGYALGYNDALGQGGKTAHNGSLRAVIDDETGKITIVVAETVEDESETAVTEEASEETTEEQYTDYNYSYTAIDRVDSITTVSNSGDTTTTTTETFEQRIITELYNDSGELIMWTDYDAESGEIKGFYDGNDIPIYVEEWRDSV